MTERDRIKKLFRDLYSGDPWIDVTLDGTLQNIEAEKAAKKISAERNSIWQIVNHLISWRQNVLRRLEGEEIITPQNNYFEPVNDTSEEAWHSTLAKLEDTQRQWVSFLENFDEGRFSRVYADSHTTYYELIHGILQHDAYHLGQIVLLSKML